MQPQNSGAIDGQSDEIEGLVKAITGENSPAKKLFTTLTSKSPLLKSEIHKELKSEGC
ncbi:hypothetical protein M501DRAFT_998919 [Patellaria atrata CBS 101060]|uniref:Uncharacterized protein n=1 Tax=Patellaria atrata CBS 101060 TaxID=1346257 RepID=A0A9P4VIR4_9PEZI|nr:hypothetical protein M501DRAFT_1001216 [Patellaria atrata CBS 101060]KAF2842574.1 hypothetical protein M501DRAFT_998919 [Patellaria atrata CBS 101060]